MQFFYSFFQIFFYISEIVRFKFYVYANIECAGYQVENIDTIAADGSIDRNSALHLAVYGDTDDHLKLLDGFMINLLFKKWHGYVKYK